MMSLRHSAKFIRRCFSVNAPACSAAVDPIQVTHHVHSSLF